MLNMGSNGHSNKHVHRFVSFRHLFLKLDICLPFYHYKLLTLANLDKLQSSKLPTLSSAATLVVWHKFQTALC